MFFPDNPTDFALAYIEARQAKVPRLQMGNVERAGYFLLVSATHSQDGEMCPSDALKRALLAGEVTTALILHEGLMAEEGHQIALSSATKASICGTIRPRS